MPSSIRIHYFLLHLAETLLVIGLVAGAFLLPQLLDTPLPWPWLTASALVLIGASLYLSWRDKHNDTLFAAILFCMGIGLLLGPMCHAGMNQSKYAENILLRVGWLGLVGLPAYAAIRRLWEKMNAYAQIDGLPYPLWRRELARIACDADMYEEYRLAAALHLRMPDDEEVLRKCLPTLRGYATYDLSHGWPHSHLFKETGSDVTDSEEGLSIVTTREECSCGVVRTSVSERRYVGTEMVCPNCGGEVVTAVEDIWMGGHFTYMEVYACSSCGQTDDTDFSVAREILDEKRASVTYT